MPRSNQFPGKRFEERAFSCAKEMIGDMSWHKYSLCIIYGENTTLEGTMNGIDADRTAPLIDNYSQTPKLGEATGQLTTSAVSC